MDITKQNFLEQLPSIREAIQNATFFAMDCEFTGLASDRTIFPFDTPEEVYLKMVENSPPYIIVQFGLCAFRVEPPGEEEEEEEKKDGQPRVSYQCYNFYCYPKGRTNVFSCQGESMRFLADNGFDFNRLFREGLSYANETEEQRYRADLKDRQATRAANILAAAESDLTEEEPKVGEVNDVNMIPVPPEHQQQVDDTAASIEEFLQSDRQELIVGSCNAFQRKLIYQMIEQRYQRKVSTSTVSLENNQKAIKVERKRSTEEEQALDEQRRTRENDDLETNVGLSLVLQELAKARKLIIGHNMLLDLFYVLRQFFKPLPADYQEFKKLTKEYFPLLLDTKYLCTNAEIKVNVNSSVLAHVYDAVSKAPFSIPTVHPELPDYQYSVDDEKKHEAGYDAYLTGLCFLGLVSKFKANLLQLPKDPNLKHYLNRIFITRLTDVNYIYLNGKEPTQTREHIFYATFPETWRTGDIQNKFKPFGPVHVSWLDNTSAFVALHNRSAASSVLKMIGYHSGFKVYNFAQFTQMKLQRPGAKRGRNGSSSASPGEDPGVRSAQPVNQRPSGEEKGQKEGKKIERPQTITTAAKRKGTDEATPPTNEADKDATAAKDDEHENDEDNGGGWRTVKKARKTFTDNNDW
ncbi:poly(A)-specific ribonuclease PARN-like isoform X1 [Anopheles arabiensis]|uniref:Poly(A)-specific ribonuclease RNA-binding domain-containing protein n=1 Tax=Anopheles arabiensis TaxID=7173 RepID=A0A182I366_ANOAR|nr:poly(A)-specific ribonuclease PARN-like isoform X1 [Anopheles arabiensis]